MVAQVVQEVSRFRAGATDAGLIDAVEACTQVRCCAWHQAWGASVCALSAAPLCAALFSCTGTPGPRLEAQVVGGAPLHHPILFVRTLSALADLTPILPQLQARTTNCPAPPCCLQVVKLLAQAGAAPFSPAQVGALDALILCQHHLLYLLDGSQSFTDTWQDGGYLLDAARLAGQAGSSDDGLCSRAGAAARRGSARSTTTTPTTTTSSNSSRCGSSIISTGAGTDLYGPPRGVAAIAERYASQHPSFAVWWGSCRGRPHRQARVVAVPGVAAAGWKAAGAVPLSVPLVAAARVQRAFCCPASSP